MESRSVEDKQPDEGGGVAGDRLPDVGIIGKMAPEMRERLARVGRFETLKPGSRLATQGEPHGTLAVILEGHVAVTVHAHGDTVRLADLGAGATVGEMSLIDPQNASADVTVIEGPARVWMVDGGAFQDLVENDPSLGFAVLKVLAVELCQRLRAGSEKMLKREETMRDHYREMDY